jgi:glycosyltransferase involved in cell wall biosynthesis
MDQKRGRFLSFVIPIFNEEATLRKLHEGIVDAARSMGREFEIIFVDDGSNDSSAAVLRDLCWKHPHNRAILLAVNRGKATALDIGFRNVRGEVVITMDSDLQDDPAEIERFVATLEEGYDLVSGWKTVRRDPWHKTLPSRFFNFVVRLVCGVPIHDVNCGFKAYSRRAIDELSLYGELHRFTPVFVANSGGKITEIPIEHHPRRHGHSKYGLRRLPKGLFDLLTVVLTTRYLKRPMHFFGWLGLLSSSVGGVILTYLAILWVMGVRPIGTRPLLFYGLLMVVVGVQLFSLGLLGELINRFSHKSDPGIMLEKIGFDGESYSDSVTEIRG